MHKLEAKKIGYHIKSKEQKILIDKFDAIFSSGNLHVILGPNGSGKSTLLKNLCGIWEPTQGKILWNSYPLNNYSRKELSRIISLVPQTPSFHFDFSVSDMVAMGCYAHNCSLREEQLIIEEALKAVDAWHLKDRLLSHLSGGERQRIYIARSLATRSPILLLDEPTAHLDIKHQLEVWILLKNLTFQGKLVIVATHDLWAAKQFSDQVIVMDQGKQKALGLYEEVMTCKFMQDCFGISPEVIKMYAL